MKPIVQAWVMPLTFVIVGACGMLAGCRPQSTTESEVPTLSVTHWTERSEAFIEHPPLVAGQTVRFAVHLTDLRDFKPVAVGRPRMEFRSTTGQVVTLVGSEPARPGVFRVDGPVPPPGTYAWSLAIETPALADRHDLGSITVYPDEDAVRAADAGSEGAPAVTYLKEQQWTQDFATAPVDAAELRVALRVPATVTPLPHGQAVVSTPAPGRLAPGPLVGVGQRVAADEVLARLEPRLGSVQDRASLAAEVTEGRAAVEAAEIELGRAERLLGERAVPARRVEDARRALAVAQARLHGAETRLELHDQTLRTGGGTAGGNVFNLRAPITGRIVSVSATPGATYEAGTPLFTIVQTDRVVLDAHVPPSEVGRISAIETIAFEVPGRADPVSLTPRHLANPGVIDSQSRTLELQIEVDNLDGQLVVGQMGTALLYTRERRRMPAVAVSAILTDAGRPIVFVQVAGERFERRVIELGPREGDLVGVVAGLKVGDRAVTRGAYEVRLASASGELPAEGHVH